MLNLSVETKLRPTEAFDLAYEYFGGEIGLKIVEMVGHLHTGQGFAEVRLSDRGLGKDGTEDSREVLREILAHLESSYGLETAHYLLHLHSVPEETLGHLVVKVTAGNPAEVELSSDGYDEQVKEFASRLK